MISLENLRAISPGELAILAVEDIAYVKPATVDGHSVYAIHAADGTMLGLAQGREAAFANVLANDLTPVSVH